MCGIRAYSIYAHVYQKVIIQTRHVYMQAFMACVHVCDMCVYMLAVHFFAYTRVRGAFVYSYSRMYTYVRMRVYTMNILYEYMCAYGLGQTHPGGACFPKLLGVLRFIEMTFEGDQSVPTHPALACFEGLRRVSERPPEAHPAAGLVGAGRP